MALGTDDFTQTHFSGPVDISCGGEVHKIDTYNEKQGRSSADDEVELGGRSHPEIGGKVIRSEVYSIEWKKIDSFGSVTGFAYVFICDGQELFIELGGLHPFR